MDKPRSLTAKTIPGDPGSWGEHRWYAENVNIFPLKNTDFENIQYVIDEFILQGHVPSKPLIAADENIITLGSCFAEELRQALLRAKHPADSFWVPSGLNNTFALLDFVSWSITGEQTSRAYRYDRDADGVISEWTPENERLMYASHFKNAGAIVFTIGLAEVWEDQETKSVFWRGVPEHIFDSNKHIFRLTTVEENYQNLRDLIQIIRQVNTDAPIVLTLSPVPLKATFRPISCITADCVSKSVLRVALDQVTEEKHENVYYWPSFEIVKWIGCHLNLPTYGYDDGRSRHVSRFLVERIIQTFLSHFLI